MNVLSCFDGISVARVALEKAGIKVDNYYASEIDKYAIEIAKKNYPDTVHVGDVSKFGKEVPYPPQLLNGGCDLMIFGSPCTDLSIAKKDRKGLEGPASKLFYEAVRIMDDLKPKYFLMENVNSMSKESKAIITEVIGVEPIMINAGLVSAQNRKRLFWIGQLVGGHYEKIDIPQPEDMGIYLKDILQHGAEVDERMVMDGKAFSLTASYNGAVAWNSIARKQRTMVRVGQFNSGGQGDRVYSDEGKSVSLSANGGGRGAKTELYLIVPEATKQGYAIATEGDSVDVSFPTSKTRRGRVGNKAKNLMTSQNIGVFTEGAIRKLTPVECERLQSIPDNYTEGISKTQRYKCVGNAFNANVVAHILSFIPKEDR